MAISVQKAGKSLLSKKSKIKGLIIGDSGAGKSHLIATCPKPLILLTEPNGAVSIATSNPDALVIEVNTLRELNEALRAIKDGTVGHPFETVVIDSLTEMQAMIKYNILDKSKRQNLALSDWGTLHREMEKYVRAIRDLPYHIICTALIDVSTPEDEGVRYVYPMFEGKKTKQSISKYFNGVGLLYKEGASNSDGIVQRKLMLDGPDRIKIKPFPNTGGIISSPNLSEIFNQILQIKTTRSKAKLANPPMAASKLQ